MNDVICSIFFYAVVTSKSYLQSFCIDNVETPIACFKLLKSSLMTICDNEIVILTEDLKLGLKLQLKDLTFDRNLSPKASN